jgi:hypothetical protein
MIVTSKAQQVHQAEVAAVNDQALLGLATTQQLLRELSVRGEVSALVETDPQPALWLQAAAEGMLQILPEHLLNYRTVDERPEPALRPVTSIRFARDVV